MRTDPVENRIKECLRRLWQWVENTVVLDAMSRRDLQDEKGITFSIAQRLSKEGEAILNQCLDGVAHATIDTWYVEHSSSDEFSTGADLAIAITVDRPGAGRKEKAVFLQAKRLQDDTSGWKLKLGDMDTHGIIRAKRQACALRQSYPTKAGAFLLYGPDPLASRMMETGDVLELVGASKLSVSLDDCLGWSEEASGFLTKVYECSRGTRNKKLVKQVQRQARGERVTSRRRAEAAVSISISENGDGVCLSSSDGTPVSAP